MLNFDFSVKGLKIVSPPHFVYDFSRKMCLMLYSINCLIILFHCLIAFTDIGQYGYCNYLLTRLWRHKFWNLPYLSNEAVFLNDQKVKTKMEISWEWKELLLMWNKKHYSSFQRALSCEKLFKTWECNFKMHFSLNDISFYATALLNGCITSF